MSRESVRISVIVPLHNKAEAIRVTVRSILAQRMSEFELLVVDDGSTDGSSEAISEFQDSRLIVVRQPNLGEGAARNRGIDEAQGDLVAFCDADDFWLPAFLQTIVRLECLYPECAVFATTYLMREPSGTYLGPAALASGTPRTEGVLSNYFEIAARSGTPWCSSSVAVRREAIASIGGFPAGVAVGADLLAWARLASRYKIALSTTPQSVFNLRSPYPSLPVRTPDVPDVVGNELREIACALPASERRVVHRYVSSWHRVRASMFLHQDRRSDALKDSWRAIRYAPTDPRAAFGMMVALIPLRLRDGALSRYRRWKRACVSDRPDHMPPSI